MGMARTPIGKFGGGLAPLSPAELAAEAMRAALDRANVDGGDLDGFVFGNVLRAGHGQLIPRQASLKAGIPAEVDGHAVDMVCSSGMMAIQTGAASIRTGDAEIVLAGGVESMSSAGFYLSHKARWGYKLIMGQEPVQDILMCDGLIDPTTGEKMGAQAERVASEHGLSRREIDEAAVGSHRRASAATEAGYFSETITPVELKSRKGTVVVDRDEGIRGDSTEDGLAGLRPAFSKDGVLTAGNASQISDGAAALVLASSDAVEKHALQPIARVLGGTMAAGETWRFPEATNSRGSQVA